MKKILSIVFCISLAFSVLTGCGNQNGTVSQTKGSSEVVTPNTENPDKSQFIGEERAKEIALERAGISGDDIVFDRVELDFDDGIWEYEVEFRQGRTEYDAVIGAVDGKVISFETDID